MGYKLLNARETLRPFKVSNTATIAPGDIIVLDGNGYAETAAAGANAPIGITPDAVLTLPSGASDGFATILVNVDPSAVFELAAASVTLAMQGKTCDVGGAQSIDVAASTDDCIRILDVDVTRAVAAISIIPKLGGVV